MNESLCIRQIIPDKYCAGCSGCCRFAQAASAWTVHLSLDDQRALGVSGPAIPVKKDLSGGQFLCSYFDVLNGGCSVYAKRPFECRLYPFVINRQKDGIFLALDLNCPFAAENYEKPEMKDFIVYMRSVCVNPLFLRLLKENPCLVQEYPGTMNIFALPI